MTSYILFLSLYFVQFEFSKQNKITNKKNENTQKKHFQLISCPNTFRSDALIERWVFSHRVVQFGATNAKDQQHVQHRQLVGMNVAAKPTFVTSIWNRQFSIIERVQFVNISKVGICTQYPVWWFVPRFLKLSSRLYLFFLTEHPLMRLQRH